MTAHLEVIIIYGEAAVDDVAEALESFEEFEAELVRLEVAEPGEAEELASSPAP